MRKKMLINWLGLLGVVSFVSYTAAVVVSPADYPGYNRFSQAVSDLSALNAPSLGLWNKLSALYGLCSMVSIMMVCVAVQNRLNVLLRGGIYLFAAMQWVSGVGYTAFPLSESGAAGGFQNSMHWLVAIVVAALSVLSLVLISCGGFRKKYFVSLAMYAVVGLGLMLAGVIGVNIAPATYLGLFERLSVFSAVAFNAVLGFYLFLGRFDWRM